MNGRNSGVVITIIMVNYPVLPFAGSIFLQVVCGQNCTFVIQPNGTVLACGEGSYGRLGQGNSDDLHVLTVVSALQGTTITTRFASTSSVQSCVLMFSICHVCSMCG